MVLEQTSTWGKNEILLKTSKLKQKLTKQWLLISMQNKKYKSLEGRQRRKVFMN